MKLTKSSEDDEEYADVGDLVIATVNRIVGYGAYVSLDEYPGREGLVHISEISTRWVRNIKDHMREGQKLVLKVLRIDPSRGQIDLSLRRVTGREKVDKMLEWKRDKKAESILKGAAERLGDSYEIDRLKMRLLEKNPSLYDALEECLEGGEKAFQELGLPDESVKIITELVKTKIKPEEAKVLATLELRCIKPDGINAVKKALIKAKEIKKPRRSKIRTYTIGAPKYRIEVVAGSYPEAERLLDNSVEEAVSTIKRFEGHGKRLR